jgi:hypothetical protein
MAGFIYFISGDERPMAPDKARKLGLGYAFTGNLENSGVNHNSPSGKPGNVFGDTSRHNGKRVGYFADQQTWRKMPRVEGRPELWVGYWNDSKPTPADLARHPMLPGEVVMTLGDGEQWLIPTLTEFDQETQSGQCQLPAPLDYDEDGNLVNGKPTGAYGQLWDAVHPVALGVCFGSNAEDSDIKEPNEKQVRDAAFAIIGANYVVSMPELVVLGALQSDATFRNIILASCRGRWLIDAVNELSKKNEPPSVADGSDTSAGKAA